MLLYVCEIYKKLYENYRKTILPAEFSYIGEKQDRNKIGDLGTQLEHLGSNFAYLRFMLDKMATSTANVSPTWANIAPTRPNLAPT